MIRSISCAALLSCCALLGAAGSVQAAGFMLTEQSALSLGRAYAGAGVAGGDIADMYYNPAALTMFPGTQFQMGTVACGLNLDWAGNDAQKENGRAKPEAIPHLFLTHQINDQLYAGLGITVPFGLATDYDNNWTGGVESPSPVGVGAMKGTHSKIMVINVNPAVAWQVSDKLSFGAGVAYQYVKVNLRYNWATPLLYNIGYTSIKLHTGDFGWNVGATWKPLENVRVGASYRSAITHSANGVAYMSNGLPALPVLPPALQGAKDMSANITMDSPAWAMLSAAWDVNSWLSLYGTFRWTDWSGFKTLTITTPVMARSEAMDWKDTYLGALGYEARVNSFWTLRGGIAYETGVISNPQTRTATIPDADRWWFAIGSTFNWTKNFQTDVSFAHLHGVHERSLYYNSDGSSSGKFRKLDAYLLGFQAQYRF